jgi:cell division protein FtsN
MTRDFAKKRSRPQASSSKSQVPAWVWLFTGSVLGAFVMFLVYLAGVPPQPSAIGGGLEGVTEAIQEARPDASATDSTEDEVPQPRFDFYQLLKESEVVVKPEPIPEAVARRAEREAESIEYILQVGSFKNSGDADRLRAQLLLLNLDARVETVRVRNAETWHRVLVGPFRNQTSMAKARGTLADNQMNSLLLKRNIEG